MRLSNKAVGAGLIAAGIFLGSAAPAMSLQSPSARSGGSANLVDPDEAVEHMADHQRPDTDNGRVRAFSDSAMEARDAVRPPVSDGRAFLPFRPFR